MASACFGTLSGSAVANVASTGSVTIPLMKSIGYDKEFAGAVEAVASTGGQIMPPMMGAAAFILAQNVAIPYIQVAAAAAIPAVLYFVAVYFQVDLRAGKLGLKGTPKEDIPNFWKTLKEGWMLLIPIILMVYFLAQNKSAQFAALIAIASLLIVSSLHKKTRMDGRRIMEGIMQGIKDCAGVSVTSGAAGVIIGGISNTGLNLIFAHQIIKICNMHPRVNILQPGPGVGGHCISVDPWFLVGDYPSLANVINESMKTNDSMPDFVLERIYEIMKEKGLTDISRVGLYGLTYKENVDDMRESPTLQLLESQQRHLAPGLKVYDPFITSDVVDNQYHSLDSFLDAVDLVVIMVKHNEIKENMSKLADKVVLDCHNICDLDGVYHI